MVINQYTTPTGNGETGVNAPTRAEFIEQALSKHDKQRLAELLADAIEEIDEAWGKFSEYLRQAELAQGDKMFKLPNK